MAPRWAGPAPPSLRGHWRSELDEWKFIVKIAALCIGFAKQVFQLRGADRRGRTVHRAKVSRGALFASARRFS